MLHALPYISPADGSLLREYKQYMFVLKGYLRQLNE